MRSNAANRFPLTRPPVRDFHGRLILKVIHRRFWLLKRRWWRER